MHTPTYHRLRVRNVIEETADAKSLVFDVPAHLRSSFTYRPGQFLTLRVPHGDGHLPRCYSLASAPASDDAPRVTIKRVEAGRASNWLCEQVQAGDELDVMPPAGVFTPKSLDGDFLLFAGGSGITPVFSILRSALTGGAGRLCLIYANRDQQSIIFRDALRALASAHPHRLQVLHWLDAVQGVPSVAQLAELARPWRGAESFICGPAPFMDAAVEALHALEIPPARIHVERFVSLPEEGGPGAPAAEGGGAQVRLDVELNGELHELSCSDRETVLDALLRAGIDTPYSCRAGACATCMCTLVAGKVTHRRNDVLDKNDLDQGWCLACQAVPDAAHVRLRFPD
ncbi:ferredoxin--NADP reductase [Pseudoduganella namucuonensis]|uniref:3-ketosteroid 9alpha-monooxygenase subunit B n=1 Tax=Pseudoduganella namucuonensis TaxID=1035707 RepID=A0A1I7LS07_9BURK|nr:ferredoxin--NADP reductase [Pseudoduganella namucuonensis]SFV12475.1 3-ketosteroid 9alpha-monooxygenase subunit B [Pseudoduganella namucuonensis]